MTELRTWGGKTTFSYSGSVMEGTTVSYGRGNSILISATIYNELLKFFSGRAVNIGTSRSNPPNGSLGQWLICNCSKVAIASYIGAILIHEGYAYKSDKAEIRFRYF